MNQGATQTATAVDIDVTVDGTRHPGWYQIEDGLITVTRPFCGGSKTTHLGGHVHAPGSLARLLLRELIDDERRLSQEREPGCWSLRVSAGPPQ